jgi:hypothetical protein
MGGRGGEEEEEEEEEQVMHVKRHRIERVNGLISAAQPT